jgi:hypothetical protein
MSLTLNPANLARREAAEAGDYYQVGQAYGFLVKSAARPVAAPVLHGRLIVTPHKWGMILVPNSLIRGVFDAIDEPGVELPLRDGVLKGHISVFRPEEIDKIGGENKISERGHPFSYQLGPLMEVDPKGWEEMSKAWFIKVMSPELKALRRSYGLSPLPNNDHEFHITVAVRRKNVLGAGATSKAAAADEDDDEDVHSGLSDDVHQSEEEEDSGADNDDGKVRVKIPLSIQRICITRISLAKPNGKEKGEDSADSGLDDFMDMLRSKSGSVKEAAGLADAFKGMGKGLGQAVLGAGRSALQRVGSSPVAGSLASLGKQFAAAPAAMTRQALGNTARFVASVPAGQNFTGQAGAGALSRAGTTLKNLGRIAVAPRYPGLDRPVGVTSMNRPFDATRAMLGNIGRKGSIGAMGLSGVAIGNAALRTYPNWVGQHIADATGQGENAENIKATMRSEAPGFYGHMIKDTLTNSQEPASKFVRGVIGDIAVPTIRNDIYNARQTKPWLMGAIDTLRSTTPAGWLATQGLKAFGSETPPDIAGAVQQHAPGLLAGTAENPEAVAASPYAGLIKSMTPAVAPQTAGQPSAAEGVAHYIRTTNPENARERYNQMRRLLPQMPLASIAGNIKAGSALEGLTPVLAGAGLGGLAGNLYGRFRGSEDLWSDTLGGAAVGGAGGAAYSLVNKAQGAPTIPKPVPRPYTPPPGSQPKNLVEAVKPYYANVPGGVEGAIARAQANQAPVEKSLAMAPWKAEDIRANIPVSEITKDQAAVDPRRPPETSGATLKGWSESNFDEAVRNPNAPTAKIKMITPPDSPEDSRQLLEHELTHAGIQLTPMARTIRETGRAPEVDEKAQHSGAELVRRLGGTPSSKMLDPKSFENYATSARELDPRLAQIKRFYAEHSGQDVTTPEEAKNAMNWFRAWIKSPEGQARAGATGRDWESLFQLPEWQQTLEGAAARRMPGLVDISRLDPNLKAAADAGVQDLLKDWKPPEKNPFAGFEGFAQTFHAKTPREQAIESLGRIALMAAPPLAMAGGLALWRPWEQSAPPKPVRRRMPVEMAKVAGAAEEHGIEFEGKYPWSSPGKLHRWSVEHQLFNQAYDRHHQGGKVPKKEALRRAVEEYDQTADKINAIGLGAFTGGLGGWGLNRALGGEHNLAAQLGGAALGGLGGWGLHHLATKYGETKTAAVSDVMNSIYAQLPRIRVPDTAVGAGVGALGGLGYDLIRGGDPKARWRQRIGRILTGAGAGALAGNVIGDRTRRYISNSFVPFSYENNPAQALKPRSLSHIWNAAILDKPQYQQANEEGLKRLQAQGKPVVSALTSKDYDYRKDTLENYMLPARREIFRRQLGVHTENPLTDIWKEGPNDQLFLNPKNPKSLATAQRFMGSMAGGIPKDIFSDVGDARRYLNAMSSDNEDAALFSSAVTGGQQVPFKMLPGGKGIEGSVLDRWDYTLDPKEQAFFKDNIKNMLTNPKWRQAKFAPKEPLSGYMDPAKINGPNSDAWKALAARWGLDNLVSYKHPWITQRFRIEPNPEPVKRNAQGFMPFGTPQQIQLLSPTGENWGDPITQAGHAEFKKHPSVIPAL